MKTSVLLFLILVNQTPNFSPALQSLIDAERNFAQTSVDKNIKAAFLGSLDESGIVFKKGEPVNGLKNWEAEAESNGYLFWWPVYADIASSHELGYTTGPAVFGEDRTEKKATGGIYYASVWRKNKAGVWKVVVDLGSSTFPADGAKEETKTTSSPLIAKPKKIVLPIAEKELLTYDQTYLAGLNKTRKSFSSAYFSEEGRLHRPRIAPLITGKSIEGYTEENKFEFEQSGGGISLSADMGYTYGKVKVELMRDGEVRTIAANYIRVWKKENGSWKIVLDVIGT